MGFTVLYFNDNKRLRNDLQFSKYQIICEDVLLNRLYEIKKKYPNIYLIGPIYAIGDFQVCITGTGKRNEKIDNTINRELQEELGVKIETKNIIHSEVYNDIRWSQKINSLKQCNTLWTICETNINNVKPINIEDVIMNDMKDDIENKVAIIIYDEKEELINKLMKIKLVIKSRESIIGICIIPIGLAIKMINYRNKNIEKIKKEYLSIKDVSKYNPYHYKIENKMYNLIIEEIINLKLFY